MVEYYTPGWPIYLSMWSTARTCDAVIKVTYDGLAGRTAELYAKGERHGSDITAWWTTYEDGNSTGDKHKRITEREAYAMMGARASGMHAKMVRTREGRKAALLIGDQVFLVESFIEDKPAHTARVLRRTLRCMSKRKDK